MCMYNTHDERICKDFAEGQSYMMKCMIQHGLHPTQQPRPAFFIVADCIADEYRLLQDGVTGWAGKRAPRTGSKLLTPACSGIYNDHVWMSTSASCTYNVRCEYCLQTRAHKKLYNLDLNVILFPATYIDDMQQH